MRIAILALTRLLIMTGTSAAAHPDIVIDPNGPFPAVAMAILPADHPRGTGATITLISLRQMPDLPRPVLAAYFIDYAPGGSAVLHGRPGIGYVLVHVLSGTLRAEAWQAGVGTYRSGETWVEPAFANDITSQNASATEPARALVIVVTHDTDMPDANDE